MIRNKYLKIIGAFFCLFFLQSEIIFAQKRNEKASKSSEILIKTVVVDSNEKPIQGATVIVGEGLIELITNKEGGFSVKTTTTSSILIKALGFKKVVFNLSNQTIPEKVILDRDLLFSSEADIINLPLNLTTSKRELVGSVSKIDGVDLTKYPDLAFSNTLQGRLAGLYVQSTSSGLGNNTSILTIRGLNRGGSDGALTLVDGIERPIDFLNAEEIENIEVIKDPSIKILYGPRAANGVVLITTKRGEENTKVLKVSTEYGMSEVSRLPDYLNSFEYASLYNEARANDGFTPFYSATQLTGYQSSTGANDQLYPDVDYYDYFLRNSAPIKRANVDYSGGGNGSKYALVLGYTGAQGFEKIGKTPTQDRLNLRGNLDFQVSPNFKAFVDASGIVDRRLWSGFDQGQVFNALSSYRPNENPIFLTDPALLAINPPLGLAYVPPLGGSLLRPSNVLGNLVYGGNTQHNFFYGQTNFGLDINLNKLVKGFTFKTVFNFDNYQFFQSGRSLQPITYLAQPGKTALGVDTTTYTILQRRINANNDSRQAQDISRNYGFNATLGYLHKFENSEFKASLTNFYYKFENQGSFQDIENTNTVLNTLYNVKNKLYFNGSLALMGTNKLEDKNKLELFPAFGFAWILSEENFAKNLNKINYLKIKGSFGVLGYDRATAFYQFQSRWSNNGTFTTGETNNSTNVPRTGLDLIGNPNLGWEKSREINVGLEGLAFNSKLNFDINYFNNLRYDIIINPSGSYSSLAGGLYPRLNQGETFNRGFDGSLNWFNQIGDFGLTIGGNFTYSKNRVNATANPLTLDPGLNVIGQPSDVIFGYVSEGLFKSQAEIDAAPVQALGIYRIGDIRYKDLNGDNLVDARDRQVIGNNFPRLALGLNININYKNFGLYVLGTSFLGVDNNLNNSFYRNNGEGKYSALALQRFHPTNNPNGTYPSLTTLNGANNNVNSTFWIQNGNFFRLKNIELSYSMNKASSVLKNYTLFLRGTNLFVISKNKDLDPEVINAAVTNYPIYRTITLGGAVKF